MTQFSILLAVTIGGLVFIFLYVRRRVNKALELDGLMDKLREEVGGLIRDLNQTTDRNLTLVEDAIRSLRDAAAEADRRVAILKQESKRHSAEDAVYDRLGRKRVEDHSANLGEREDSVLSPPPAAVSRGSLPKAETEAGKTMESPTGARSASLPFVTFSSTPIQPKPTVREEIVELSRKGISAELIASKLGITVAEIELILYLEEREGRNPMEKEV